MGGYLAPISSGLGSLKAAYDLAKGMNAANTQATVNDVKIPLQQHILNAQDALAAVKQEQLESAEYIRKLEQKIVEFENWEAEKQRYELADPGQGTVAYRPKAGMENGEPPHWLCAQCFQQGKKAFLQPELRFPGRNSYLCCATCKAEMITEGDRNTAYEKPHRR